MAENLNYNAEGSVCYGEGGKVHFLGPDEGDIFSIGKTKTLSDNEIQANCAKYGRLYDWKTAKMVCPKGWHLPSNEEWDKLFRFVDSDTSSKSPYKSLTADKHLKAASGWNSVDGVSGNGTDAHGFSALPGGFGNSSRSDFSSVGFIGFWWCASEYDSNDAYIYGMDYKDAGRHSGIKSALFSVRCVQD